MIKLDRMLMIGSAGQNVGKTELACTIISKLAESTEITGVKVTAIEAKDGQCPRGSEGCGICPSLEGDFCITRETDSSSKKDTGRLLAAGASEVYWLRVMKTHLEKGLKALLDTIEADAVIVCESNSLRQVAEPGLFFIVRDESRKTWKTSARNVKKYADEIVLSDGKSFDFDIERIEFIDGRWVIRQDATAIIMAGGESSRIGFDKSMLLINNKPMIEVVYEQLRGSFEQIVISANESEKLAFLGLEIIGDREAGHGPLMGIASAIEASANEVNFVVACDIPYIDLRYVRMLLAEARRADIVIPKHKGAKENYEPLFAVYCKSALDAINEVLSSGARKISDVFGLCRVKYVELELAQRFVNINTMDEYEKFRKKHDA